MGGLGVLQLIPEETGLEAREGLRSLQPRRAAGGSWACRNAETTCIA